MVKNTLIIFLMILLPATSIAADININGPAQIFFSPNGGCTTAIVKKIDEAKSEIYVAAYSFSSIPIGNALVNAKKRGILVETVIDDSNMYQTYSLKDLMFANEIPVYMDKAHAIMHNKFIVIDSIYVITGSFNFSANAESKNGENIIILKSTQAANVYKQNWAVHKTETTTYRYAK